MKKEPDSTQQLKIEIREGVSRGVLFFGLFLFSLVFCLFFLVSELVLFLSRALISGGGVTVITACFVMISMILLVFSAHYFSRAAYKITELIASRSKAAARSVPPAAKAATILSDPDW